MSSACMRETYIRIRVRFASVCIRSGADTELGWPDCFRWRPDTIGHKSETENETTLSVSEGYGFVSGIPTGKKDI